MNTGNLPPTVIASPAASSPRSSSSHSNRIQRRQSRASNFVPAAPNPTFEGSSPTLDQIRLLQSRLAIMEEEMTSLKRNWNKPKSASSRKKLGYDAAMSVSCILNMILILHGC
jgi:hypothetical protein